MALRLYHYMWFPRSKDMVSIMRVSPSLPRSLAPSPPLSISPSLPLCSYSVSSPRVWAAGEGRVRRVIDPHETGTYHAAREVCRACRACRARQPFQHDCEYAPATLPPSDPWPCLLASIFRTSSVLRSTCCPFLPTSHHLTSSSLTFLLPPPQIVSTLSNISETRYSRAFIIAFSFVFTAHCTHGQ